MTSYEPQGPSSNGKKTINLLRGWPNPSLLATDLIRNAAQAALSSPSQATSALEYGEDPGPQALRESIAKWLTGFYYPDGRKEEAVEADRLCITGGASQNLGSILSVYSDASYTRAVWIVAPAYFLAFRTFGDHGLKMRAVPEDGEGVDISYLRREMEKLEHQAEKEGMNEPRFKKERSWAKIYKHVVYCVPTFANPSSRTMPLQRRKDLVTLAREFDALVIADDVYDFLQWPTTTNSASSHTLQTAHLPRLVDIDRTLHPVPSASSFGNTCSNASFSKIAGPGTRTGWLEGTPRYAYGVSQVGTTKSGAAPSQLTAYVLNLLLESGGLQKHIREVLQPAYQRRWGKLVGAIETELVPLGFALPQLTRDVAGGYFTWIHLPAALSSSLATRYAGKTPAELLAERCLAEENVIIAPGTMSEVPGDNSDSKGLGFGHCVRLCWSWEDEDALAEAVGRVARVAKSMLREGKKGLSNGYVMVEKKGAVG